MQGFGAVCDPAVYLKIGHLTLHAERSVISSETSSRRNVAMLKNSSLSGALSNFDDKHGLDAANGKVSANLGGHT